MLKSKKELKKNGFVQVTRALSCEEHYNVWVERLVGKGFTTKIVETDAGFEVWRSITPQNEEA